MSSSAAQTFLQAITARRSIYALGRKQVLPDAELTKLIQSIVKQSPSAFNSQSSRVVILLGAEHDALWGEIAPTGVKSSWGEQMYEGLKGKLAAFQGATGTVLFFESEDTIKASQERNPAFAQSFPIWSTHSTGMAQFNTWTALELAGYGANLQHVNASLAPDALQAKFDIPKSWKLHAELVFGSPEAPAGEKTFIDDAERFRVLGKQA